jgi:hypothetical protein
MVLARCKINYKERGIDDMLIKKIFKVTGQESQGWTDKDKSIIGVKIDTDKKMIEIFTIKGINLTAEGLASILLIPEINQTLKEVNNNYKRKCPYKLRTHVRPSGVTHVGIEYLQEIDDGFYNQRYKEILYITCFGKLTYGVNAFIPDLVFINEAFLQPHVIENFSEEYLKKITIKDVPLVDVNTYIQP